jgi:hypothetical protein
MDPFIPADCEDLELWPSVERANHIMQDMAIAVHERRGRGMQRVEITLGREIYRYEERSRVEVDCLLSKLDSSVSHLRLSDSSLFAVNKWLSRINSLDELRLHLYKNDAEQRHIAINHFWENVDRLRLKALAVQISLPLPRIYGNLTFLQEIIVSDVESSLDAAQLLYTHLPHLRACAINTTADRLMDITKVPQFNGDVLSKSIHAITFSDSIAPGGLIQQVAKTSTAEIDIVTLPRNATDSDLETITSFGKHLRILNMENSAHVSCLLPITTSRRIELLRIGWCHLSCLNRDVIYRFARGCHCLEIIKIAADKEHRHLEDVPLRRAFVNQFQDKSFGRWLDEFVGVVRMFFYRIEIDLEKIRQTEEFKRFCNSLPV